MKNKGFILINPNLNDNPRSKTIPKNFTPDDHLENSISLLKRSVVSSIIEKTIKKIGAKDIVNKIISGNNYKINDSAKALVEYLNSTGLIKHETENTIRNDIRNNAKRTR